MKYIKKEWMYVVLGACLVMAVYALPHVLRSQYLAAEGKPYYPISGTAYIDETLATGARFKEVTEGVLRVGDVDLYEYQGTPSIWSPLSPILMAPFLLVYGSVNGAPILGEPVISGFIFVLMYALCKQLTRNSRHAFVGALLFSFFFYIGKFIPPLSWTTFKELIGNILPYQHALWRDRLSLVIMESSVPGFLVFLPALYFTFAAFVNHSRKYFVLAAIFTGLTFYTYLYHWVFLVTVWGLLGIYALYKKEYKLLSYIAMSGVIVLLISLYYWYQYILVQRQPDAETILIRNWVEYSHQFRISEWRHYVGLVVAGFSVYWAQKKGAHVGTASVLYAMLVASFVLLNMQVITGMNVQPSHWIPRVNIFALNLSYLYAFSQLLVYLKGRSFYYYRLCAYGAIAVVSSIIIGSFHSQLVYARFSYTAYTIPHEYMAAFEWMNEATEPRSVVLTPSWSVNSLLHTYTNAKVYLPYALLNNAPQREVLDRLYISMKLFGQNEVYLRNILDPAQNVITKSPITREDFDAHRGLHYLYCGVALGTYFDAVKKDTYYVDNTLITEAVEEYRSSPVFSLELLKKYRLDYIIVGPLERLRFDVSILATYNFLEKVYDVDGVQIYHVK